MPLQPEARAEKGSGTAGKTVVILAGLVVAAGVMWGAISIPGFDDPQPAPASITAPPPSGPNVAQPQAPASTDVALQPQASQSLLQKVQPHDVERAINGMLIGEAEKERLRGEITADDTQIAWIAVSDFDFEDGDWVTISGAGYSQNIRIFRRPTDLAVPYKRGVPVTVTGLTDGDGRGITVAVHVMGARYPLASVRPGTSIQVPSP
jgi:hypothetical protein